MMMEYISNFRRRYHHELSNRMEIDRGASMPGNLADVKLVRCCTKLVAITVPIYAITLLEYPPFVFVSSRPRLAAGRSWRRRIRTR